jgi:hypothetical protein
MRREVFAGNADEVRIEHQVGERRAGLGRRVDGRQHPRQHARQAGKDAVPDEAQCARIVARQTRSGHESGIEAVDGQPLRAVRQAGGGESAVKLVGEPEVAQLAVHVGEAAVELAAPRSAGRGERGKIRHRGCRHAGAHLRIVHAGGDDDDPRRRVARQAREQQVGEQKVAEMVDRERALVAVGREGRPAVDLQAGVADQRAQRHVSALDLLRQRAHRGQ